MNHVEDIEQVREDEEDRLYGEWLEDREKAKSRGEDNRARDFSFSHSDRNDT